MSTIYDMASGRIESPPARTITAATTDELIPAPVLQELPFRDTEAKPRSVSIHLLRALLARD